MVFRTVIPRSAKSTGGDKVERAAVHRHAHIGHVPVRQNHDGVNP
jgi:hypothetical protein